MKATKNIIKLAEQATKEEMKRYEWMQEKHFNSYVLENIKQLTDVKNAILKGNYYTRVDKVSASGMSRTITIAYIKNNKLHHVDDFIYKLAGCDKNQRISGCGMDMLFAAQYNLFLKLCPNHKYQKSMKSYNYL